MSSKEDGDQTSSLEKAKPAEQAGQMLTTTKELSPGWGGAAV